MARKKLSVIGAGNVGATCAHRAIAKGLGDVVLLDIVEGLAEGKALDLRQAAAIEGLDAGVVGTTDYAATEASDVVIITSGLARKPGMSRDDLLAANARIVKEVSAKVARSSPQAVLIVVSNPVDAMAYLAWKVSGFPTRRVVGQAGILDAGRFRAFLGEAVGCSPADIQAMLLGGHGDDMVPLPRYTTLAGVPVAQLLVKETLDALVERTRKGGGEIVSLLKTGSAYYAPAAATVQMAEAVLLDRKRLLPCSAYCDRQYNVGGYFVGVPVLLGAGGVEKVVELDLTVDERAAFNASCQHVKELVAAVEKLIR